MREFIGVTDLAFIDSPSSFIDDPYSLIDLFKQHALVFDKIAISSIGQYFDTIDNKTVRNEIEYLIDNDFLFEVTPIYHDKLKKNEEIKKLYEQFSASWGKRIKLEEKLLKEQQEVQKWLENLINDINHGRLPDLQAPTQMTDQDWKDFDTKLAASRTGVSIIGSRLFSLQLRLIENFDAYPFYLTDNHFEISYLTGKSDVLNIILNKFPIPDRNTPWEQIFEFRKDPVCKGHFLGLRQWMKDMARAQIPANALEEKLEYLLDQYEKFMEINKLKYQVGLFEAVFTIALSFLESLLKLSAGKLAKPLFLIRKQKLAFLEAEMIAPGKEIAFISKAHEYFS
jgi:hypothetical protein